MTFIKNIIFGLLMLLLIPTLSPKVYPASVEELTVSAAIAFKNVFEEMGRTIESRHKGIKVLFNFGASGDLARQIAAGAPVDVFASTDIKDMEALDHQGLILSGSKINFAGNALVLIAPNNSPLQRKSFQELKDSRIKRIAIGNPITVPSGRYAQEVLTSLHLWEGLKGKLILAENVRQTLDYVARGECDAGLVYPTDARTRSKEIKVIAMAPEGSHRPILFPIGIVQGTEKKGLSNEFITLVLSIEGKDILKRYGFRNVPGKTK